MSVPQARSRQPRIAAMLSLRSRAAQLRQRALGIRPLAPEPYSTHIPVLLALARVTTVRRVLELGSGPFSTPLFLNRAAFPDLEQLTSLEDDGDWSATVLNTVGEDDRLDYRLVAPPISASLPALGEYDLVFIDDSRTVLERSETLAQVAAANPKGLVVMHDFEQRRYRSTARRSRLTRNWIFSTFTPQVGVLTLQEGSDPQRFEPAQGAIEEGAESGIPTTDVMGWLKHLDEHLSFNRGPAANIATDVRPNIIETGSS